MYSGGNPSSMGGNPLSMGLLINPWGNVDKDECVWDVHVHVYVYH